MNWLDIVIAVVLVINLLIGLKTGLIKMVISLVGLVLGILLAGHFYHNLGVRLTFISSAKAADIVAYVVILIVVLVLAGIVAGLLSKVASAIMLGWLNHIGGAILGLLMACFFVGALLAIWAKYAGSDAISGSFLAKLLLDKFPIALALLPKEFDNVRSFFR
jgi:membrane protein required for colicin V production